MPAANYAFLPLRRSGYRHDLPTAVRHGLLEKVYAEENRYTKQQLLWRDIQFSLLNLHRLNRTTRPAHAAVYLADSRWIEQTKPVAKEYGHGHDGGDSDADNDSDTESDSDDEPAQGVRPGQSTTGTQTGSNSSSSSSQTDHPKHSSSGSQTGSHSSSTGSQTTDAPRPPSPPPRPAPPPPRPADAKADDEDAAFMRLDAYELLGVPRTATLDQINRAYRAAARRAHPDKNGGKDALFKRIQQAVELLRDPVQRAAYDAYLAGVPPPAPAAAQPEPAFTSPPPDPYVDPLQDVKLRQDAQNVADMEVEYPDLQWEGAGEHRRPVKELEYLNLRAMKLEQLRRAARDKVLERLRREARDVSDMEVDEEGVAWTGPPNQRRPVDDKVFSNLRAEKLERLRSLRRAEVLARRRAVAEDEIGAILRDKRAKGSTPAFSVPSQPPPNKQPVFTVPAQPPAQPAQSYDSLPDGPLADIELPNYQDDDDEQLDPVELVGDEAKAEEGRAEEAAARAQREGLEIEELLAEMGATAAREAARLGDQVSDMPTGQQPGVVYHHVQPAGPDSDSGEFSSLPDGSELPGDGPDSAMDIEAILRGRQKRPRAAHYQGSYAGMDKPGRKRAKPTLAAVPAATKPKTKPKKPKAAKPSPAPAPADLPDQPMPQPEPSMDLEDIVRGRQKRPRAAHYQGSYAGMDAPAKRKKRGAAPASKRPRDEAAGDQQPKAAQKRAKSAAAPAATIQLAKEAVEPRRSTRLKATPKVNYRETPNRKPR